MKFLSKLNYRKNSKNNLNDYMEAQKTVHGQTLSSKGKSNAGTITTPDFKLQYGAIVTNQHDTSTKTDTGINGPRQRIHSKLSQLQPPNFNKDAKITHWRENSLFNKGAEKLVSHMQKNETKP